MAESMARRLAERKPARQHRCHWTPRGAPMPPDPVLLHAIRTAPRERVRRVLHAAMDTLAQGDDWTEMERLIREHVGLADALRILGDENGGDAAPSPQKPGRKRRG